VRMRGFRCFRILSNYGDAHSCLMARVGSHERSVLALRFRDPGRLVLTEEMSALSRPCQGSPSPPRDLFSLREEAPGDGLLPEFSWESPCLEVEELLLEAARLRELMITPDAGRVLLTIGSLVAA